MPSRSAHRAALRRAQEPSVIPPEGVTLPDLPEGMNWLNPVIGDSYARDVWNIIRILPGGAVTIASITRKGAPAGSGMLTIKGDLTPGRTLPLAQAFEEATKCVGGLPEIR